MPDKSIDRAVRELETERVMVMEENSRAFTEAQLAMISDRLEEDRLRHRVVELRAEQHEGMSLSLLNALLSACPYCHSAATIDLPYAEALDGEEVWAACCLVCTVFVEEPSPQQAFDAWNRREGVILM